MTHAHTNHARRSVKTVFPEQIAVLRDGARLRYLKGGEGPAVILLHGGMGDMTSWRPQLVAFASRFQVISYSRRHSHPNTNAMRLSRDPAAADASDLAEFMHALRVERAHLVGASYGALIALKFALACKTRVLSLSLCEPPLHTWVKELSGQTVVHDHFMRAVWASATDCFRQRRSRDAMAILARAFGINVDAPRGRSMAKVLRNTRAMKVVALAEQPFAALEPSAVQKLRVPTLVLTGQTTDEIHTIGAAELARLMEGCVAAVIPGAGHRAPIENPKIFNKVVLHFLAALGDQEPSGG